MARRLSGPAGGPRPPDIYAERLYSHGGHLYLIDDGGKVYCQADDGSGWHPCSMRELPPHAAHDPGGSGPAGSPR